MRQRVGGDRGGAGHGPGTAAAHRPAEPHQLGPDGHEERGLVAVGGGDNLESSAVGSLRAVLAVLAAVAALVLDVARELVVGRRP